VPEFEGVGFVLGAGGPVVEDEGEGGEHDCSFEFGAVAVAVKVFEGGAHAG